MHEMDRVVLLRKKFSLTPVTHQNMKKKSDEKERKS